MVTGLAPTVMPVSAAGLCVTEVMPQLSLTLAPFGDLISAV